MSGRGKQPLNVSLSNSAQVLEAEAQAFPVIADAHTPDQPTSVVAKSAETYVPEPVDTSRVCIPDEVEELREALARNAHDQWAKQRLSQGWRYGPMRRDDLKHNPCIVPYEYLSESEREYDRLTAMETVKTLYALGFEIKKVKSKERT